ncbi:crosslink repair DNA glycosylase YcaQ family protein [Galbitalea sp. SE-J8]|uniref:winged helix-turn-helix domain-containing protein n=1 Tax=Galbitalea sp. SE-J8 TaxID=3054952 RepID=UPI00259CF1E4|nr:crosslink repair DNA glycosylase YcaQ family protein [Galbitalea sp. SE-J8]MDM4763406.1 crosslink repair DNA glycosylase YcaQ family protein [Galbitalea sp. SE-J8]
MPASVSPAAARRIALAAQGFARPRPDAVGVRQLGAHLRRLPLLQLDSVNVFERSHYLPVFARLGGYDKADLDRVLFDRRGDWTEYWAHVAAVIPKEHWPLFRWRMRAMRDKYAGPGSWFQAHPEIVQWVRDALRDGGPTRASDLEHPSGRGEGGWWGWSGVKQALEHLWLFGEVVTAGRDRFERSYALPEQVMPASVLARAVPAADAQRELVLLAVTALGIGTVSDIADHYRMRTDDTRARLAELVETGAVSTVAVDGWRSPAFVRTGTSVPRRVDAGALLSPFDPVVWERGRALRLFDFHYRIEIYTPEPKRVFGYYSLPILAGDGVVGRIDLKNDRRARVLRVQSAWREPHAPADLADRVVPLLEEVVAWQGHGSVAFADRGDLIADVAGAWRGSAH